MTLRFRYIERIGDGEVVANFEQTSPTGRILPREDQTLRLTFTTLATRLALMTARGDDTSAEVAALRAMHEEGVL